MFDFDWKIKEAFGRVKEDVEGLRYNVNDWIVFLDEKGNEFEKRLDKLESKIERLEDAMFRILEFKE